MTAVTDRAGATDAPAPSPTEQAEIDRFGMFEAEETVEKVARALEESCVDYGRCSWEHLAAAAIAAMPASRAEEATDALMWAAWTVEHSPGIKHQARGGTAIRDRAAALTADSEAER